MKMIRACGCVLLILVTVYLPVFGTEAEPEGAEAMRTGMTIAGAGIGVVAGSLIAVGFSMDAIDTPLSNTLLLTIPVAAIGAASGALAGRWIANVVLKHQPKPLFAIVEGAGLGLLSGVFVGALTFATNFLIAYPVLDVPAGYWGRFDYLPTVGMALVAGGFWGGLYGMAGGAILLPIMSLLMGF